MYTKRELLERIDHRLLHVDDKIDLLTSKVRGLEEKVEVLMALVDDLKTALQKVADATTKVSNRMDDLIAQLQNNSLTAEQKTEILGDLQELADHLDAMGTNPTDPVPPEPAALTKK